MWKMGLRNLSKVRFAETTFDILKITSRSSDAAQDATVKATLRRRAN
jgi:hypothetical protein